MQLLKSQKRTIKKEIKKRPEKPLLLSFNIEFNPSQD